MASIEVLDVNDYTLKMFRAPSREVLLTNLHKILRDDMRIHFRRDLENMWAGHLELAIEGINYALDGTPIYIQLTRRALPGHEKDWSRALLAIVDITDRKRALDRAAENERYAQGLFQHSPVSLWVEDFSAVKAWIEQLRADGITNFARHLAENPQVVEGSMQLIKVLDVNQQTLTLFQAANKEELVSNLHQVFRDEMRGHWETELLDMWNGRLDSEYEGVNYALSGEPVDILMRISALPGSETAWDRVLIAISDITARKKAEAYVSYLGTHDLLTSLYNRGHYESRRHQLQKEGRYPVSILMIDLNGLKLANDEGGHEAGDALIRRAGEVIAKVAGDNDIGARIGGDEFTMLLPFQDERAARHKVRLIESLIETNNQFYGGPRLSFSIGAATAYTGQALEEVQREADKRMYEAKRAYYRNLGRDGDRRAENRVG